MTYSATRQPDYEDRTPRGLGKKTLMLEAVREVCGSEQEFMRKLVTIGFGVDGAAPVPVLLSEALKRMEPPLKPNGEKIKLDLPEGSTYAEKSLAVIATMAQGQISPDQAQMIIGILKDAIAIQESTEIMERLAKIEEALKLKQ